MKPAPFDYVAPTTIDEACSVLAEAGGGATVLAGGQTLMPLLNLRMSQPFIIVDINKIAALAGIARVDGGTRIGPMTRQCDVIASETLARDLPVLVQAVRHVGHHQTRNRGTVGGSIALGEPAAELPATAVALGATIEARSSRGTRHVPAGEFYLGPYMNALEADELVTGIIFPDWPKGHRTLFREVAQRPGDFALLGMVGALCVEGGKIARAGLAWFGMGPTPIRAKAAEQMLLGRSLDGIDPQAVAERAVADTAPFDDHHASAEYRRTVGTRIFCPHAARGAQHWRGRVSKHHVEMTINGRRHASDVEARVSLSDFLRGDAGYTGVHVGCEHGVCGACTVIVDGKAVRSCLMLAVQADGAKVTTAEGLAAPDGTLHPVQQALLDEQALQCGFCTPGMVMTLAALTNDDAKPSGGRASCSTFRAYLPLHRLSGHPPRGKKTRRR